jgi:hypothetical protein
MKSQNIERISASQEQKNIMDHDQFCSSDFNLLSSDVETQSQQVIEKGNHEIEVRRSIMNEAVEFPLRDTTIKGENGAVIDLPNQKEAPSSLMESYNEAKRPVFRNFGIMTLITLTIMTCVGVLENGSYSGSSAIAEGLLGGGIFILFLCIFPVLLLYRRKWKKPLKKLSEGLKDYKKFNKNERWFQSLQEDKGFLELIVIASLGLISMSILISLAILSSI